MTESPPKDYNLGKIYRIFSGDMEYIGSTCKTLSQRLAKHKSHYKDYVEKGAGTNIASFELLSTGSFEIELLENFPCDSKNELERRERETILQRRETHTVVNKILPAQTKEELAEHLKGYAEAHKEEIAKYKKEWAEAHKEEIVKQKTLRYIDNREEILKKRKEYYEANKVIILQKIREPVKCDICGDMSDIGHISRHKKTLKCKEFTENEKR